MSQLAMTEDRRYQHLQTQPYLRQVRFQRLAYRPYRPGWDHDHCVGCWAKFALDDDPSEPVEREGYATCADYQHGAQYEWVCVKCFADFRELMGWIEVEGSDQ